MGYAVVTRQEGSSCPPPQLLVASVGGEGRGDVSEEWVGVTVQRDFASGGVQAVTGANHGWVGRRDDRAAVGRRWCPLARPWPLASLLSMEATGHGLARERQQRRAGAAEASRSGLLWLGWGSCCGIRRHKIANAAPDSQQQPRHSHRPPCGCRTTPKADPALPHTHSTHQAPNLVGPPPDSSAKRAQALQAPVAYTRQQALLCTSPWG